MGFHDYNVRKIKPEEVAVLRFLASKAYWPLRLPPDVDELSVFVLKDDEASGYIDFVDWNLLKIPSPSWIFCLADYTDSDGGDVEVDAVCRARWDPPVARVLQAQHQGSLHLSQTGKPEGAAGDRIALVS